MPRLLLLVPQLPQDPASGAVRSLRTICEFLAVAGWSVRALAVTATEAAASFDAPAFLRDAGFDITVHQPNRAVYRHDRPVLEFSDARGIVYQLLDTARASFAEWPSQHGAQFNRLFQRELSMHRPDIVFGFGGTPDDVERYRRAQTAGCKVVFGVRNHGYRDAGWLRELTAILTPSDYLSHVYREALGLESTALPPPFDPVETIAREHEAIFFTAINPVIEKGAFFLARLAEELAVRRPDVPMLFVESRGSGGHLVQAGLAGGFDLRRHENLMFAPAVAKPAEIFRATRVLLAPSVWEEPFGRVAVEALFNGVPPLVSNRGGLPEAANGGGFVLPLPDTLTLATRMPVSAAEVGPWLTLMLQLADDGAFYAEASTRARRACEPFRPEVLAPRYLEFFGKLL